MSTPPCTGYVRSGLKGKKMKKLNPPQISQISKGQRSGTAWRKFLVNIDLIHNSKFRSLKTELWKQTANSEALLVNFFCVCTCVCRIPPRLELQGSLEGRWLQPRLPARLLGQILHPSVKKRKSNDENVRRSHLILILTVGL